MCLDFHYCGTWRRAASSKRRRLATAVACPPIAVYPSLYKSKHTMEASLKQIKEYEAQLADVQELLQASPDDAALLSLKRDLDELLALTKASLPEQQASLDGAESPVAPQEAAETEEPAAVPAPPVAVTSSEAASAAPSKKSLKIKDFEIPEHLKPLETDTEAERNKKRRAVKNLKNKWREKKKEVESTKKQQSWQSFQQKKKRKGGKSIFATQDGSNAKVGVISAGSMTEFGERKRHKHT